MQRATFRLVLKQPETARNLIQFNFVIYAITIIMTYYARTFKIAHLLPIILFLL